MADDCDREYDVFLQDIFGPFSDKTIEMDCELGRSFDNFEERTRAASS